MVEVSTILRRIVWQIGSHYFVHNLCGWSQSQPTLAGLTQATGKHTLFLAYNILEYGWEKDYDLILKTSFLLSIKHLT